MANFEYGFDRRDFLLKVVRQFNSKSNKYIIERVYNQMLEALQKQKSPYNQMDITEKIRILKECYKSFKSDEFRYGLRGVSPIKIAQDFGEEMLGILKRKYDMSDKFCPGLIGSRKLPNGINYKMVGVKPLEADDQAGIPYIDEERGFIIEQIGTLGYSDGEQIIDNIKQYRVTVPTGYGTEIERIVFTNKIDFDLLGEDENYAEAIYTELLRPNNIDKSNAGGYIGEVVVSKQMIPGEEKGDDGDFYTYQISNTHAITVDPIVVTACKILERRQKAKNKDESEGR